MCELLGFSARKATDIRPFLETFYTHSIRHPHGWGLMRELDGTFDLVREPVAASGSRKINGILRETPPQTVTLAHIRLATIGSVRLENCHPFTGLDSANRRWTLIHNGTIYSGKSLIPYLNVQHGDTDSERIFLYLLDEINRAQKAHPLTAAERFAVVDRIVAKISPRNKLNLMIYDGELMYVHKNMQETLYRRRTAHGMLFATVPLDDGGWEELPDAQLTAYHQGELVLEGTAHGGVFIPTLEYISAMDAMHI